MIIGLAPAALTLFLGHGLPLRNLALPALVSALFALFAWLLRGVTASGAIAGFGVAFTLYAKMGLGMFGVLLFLFVLTWAATRVGRSQTGARGQDRHGRTAAQVVANVGLAPILLVALPAWFGWLVLIPVTAVLAEAAADTCASEIGKAYGRKTVLITTFRPVPAGTDGGISLLGSATAIVAAGLTVALAWHPANFYSAVIGLWVVLGATLATFIDSVLGATLERRGWLNNDAVNLLSTAFAAFLAFAPLLHSMRF